MREGSEFTDPRPNCADPECPEKAVLIFHGAKLCALHTLLRMKREREVTK